MSVGKKAGLSRVEWGFWAVVLVWVLLNLVPATYWYKPGVLSIESHTVGQDPLVYYTGGPVRNFLGSYSVVAISADDGSIYAEDRSGRFNYDASRTRRPDIHLYDWWAPGLKQIPAGAWVIETCWTIHKRLLLGKTVCVRSDVFRVNGG